MKGKITRAASTDDFLLLRQQPLNPVERNSIRTSTFKRDGAAQVPNKLEHI